MKISLRMPLLSLVAAVALICIVCIGALTTSLQAATPEEDAVLAPINAMFAGMSARDAAAIKLPATPGATRVLMRDGKPTQMTIEAFADRLGKPSPNAKP